MANELLTACSVTYSKNSKRVQFGGSAYVDVSGDEYSQNSQVAEVSGGSAVAMDKGNITTLGLCVARNNGTVTINIYQTTGASVLLMTVPPGATVMFYFGSGVTAPAIRSSNASTTAELEYLLVEA